MIRTAQAVIFVLDSSDQLRIAVAKEELDLLLQHSGMTYQNKLLNCPFPSYLVSLFKKESFCKTFDMKLSLICTKVNHPVHLGGTDFHMNGFTQRLVLTGRQKATRRWPINFQYIQCML